MKKLVWLLIIILLVAGGYYFLTQQNTPAPIVNTEKPNYENAKYGFGLKYPPEMIPHYDFKISYLIPSTWSILSDDETAGEQLVEFIVPKSNNVTSSELRFGASDDPAQVSACLVAPSWTEVKSELVQIGGRDFQKFSYSDAGLGHYASVRTYHAVMNGRCFVIDQFVTGTHPENYDPPTTTPFSMEEGFTKTDQLISSIVFY